MRRKLDSTTHLNFHYHFCSISKEAFHEQGPSSHTQKSFQSSERKNSKFPNSKFRALLLYSHFIYWKTSFNSFSSLPLSSYYTLLLGEWGWKDVSFISSLPLLQREETTGMIWIFSPYSSNEETREIKMKRWENLLRILTFSRTFTLLILLLSNGDEIWIKVSV